MKSAAIFFVGALLLIIAGFWIRGERMRAAESESKLAEVTKKYDRLKSEAADNAITPTAAAAVTPLPPPFAAPGTIPTAEDNSDGLIERVGQLKRMLVVHPEFELPEFQFLSDADWLAAVQGMARDTDFDARLAFHVLRQTAKQEFLPDLRAAVKAYAVAHGGQRAPDTQALKPYLRNPAHAPILDRYEVWTGEFMNRRDWTLRERPAEDPWFVSQLYVAEEGMGVIAYGPGNEVLSALRKYREQYRSDPPSPGELRPFLREPVDDRTLNEIFSATQSN